MEINILEEPLVDYEILETLWIIIIDSNMVISGSREKVHVVEQNVYCDLCTYRFEEYNLYYS